MILNTKNKVKFAYVYIVEHMYKGTDKGLAFIRLLRYMRRKKLMLSADERRDMYDSAKEFIAYHKIVDKLS